MLASSLVYQLSYTIVRQINNKIFPAPVHGLGTAPVAAQTVMTTIIRVSLLGTTLNKIYSSSGVGVMSQAGNTLMEYLIIPVIPIAQ